jgi:hypothetical protein
MDQTIMFSFLKSTNSNSTPVKLNGDNSDTRSGKKCVLVGETENVFFIAILIYMI